MTTKAELQNIILTIQHNHPGWEFIVGKLEQLIEDDGFEYEPPPYKRGDHCWLSPNTGHLHHTDCTFTDEFGEGVVTRYDEDLRRQVIVHEEDE